MSDQQPVGFRGESGAAGRIFQETHLATARALLDTLPFYAMLVDSDHHIVVANKAVLVNLGREPSAIEGTYCPLTVHGLDHPFPGCPLEESIARGCTAAETEMFDERDGLWFASSIYPTEYRTSKDRQIFIHLVRDITAAKRSEEALQHNLQVEEVLASLLRISLLDVPLHDQLRLLLDEIQSVPWLTLQSKGAVFLVDGDSLTLKAHNGLMEPVVAGCARVPFGRCHCGAAAESGLIQFADHLDERHTPYKGMLPHGHYCVPLQSPNGIIGVLCLYLPDGHERREGEEDFLKSVAGILTGIVEKAQGAEKMTLLRELLDHSNEAIFVIDAASGRFVDANKHTWSSLGYDPEELLNLSMPTISVAIQDAAAWSAASAQTRELGHMTGEDDHRRKDGTMFPVEVDVVSVDRGDSQYILGIARDITERKNAEGRVTDTLTKLKRSLDGIIQAMATVVEMRDPYTAGHQRRVADLAVGIGREMGLHEDRLEGLRVSGLLHDIGKIAVPAEILSKPGRLTSVEFAVIRGHPEAGHAILAQIDFPWPVAEGALQHHEAMNGSGYPAGLRGDEILLESRILAVADVVEAMASHRPYRPALGIEVALAEILHERGNRFDPHVADACVRLISDKGFVFH